MDRSLYPDGVLVDRTALERTELTKAVEILRDRVDTTTRGVYSGGAVTASTINPDRIDIAAFSGFTPSGEYVYSDAAYLNLTLSDYTLATVNYVLAMYTETNTYSQPHESDGLTYPTAALGSRRVVILTEAAYTALPATDANLANNAKDRALLLAKVIAEGAGQPIITIYSPTLFNDVLYTSPITCVSITGVTVLSVGAGTPVGAGTLTFDDTSAPTYTLTWEALTGGPGAAVPFTADGTYTLYDGGGNPMSVLVNVSQLPIIGGTLAETITVVDLYYQEIPRMSSEDLLHRNKLGTGVVSNYNVHALSMEDIDGSGSSTLAEHQDKQHCNGIVKTNPSGTAIFTPSIIITTLPADTLTVTAPAFGDLYYINGIKLDSLTPTTMTWSAPLPQESSLYEIYVTDEATLQRNKKSAYPASRNVSGTWIVDMSDEYPAGSYNLSYQSIVGSYLFQWDSGPAVVITAPVEPWIIVKLFNADRTRWIDLFVRLSTGASDDYLPTGAGPLVDAITVYASPDWGTHMPLHMLSYWYSPTGTGELGYPPYDNSGTRYTVDKRIWGNLCLEDMNDNAIEHLAYEPNRELAYSGIVYDSSDGYGSFYVTASGLNVTVRGGSYYCRGERLSIMDPTVLPLADNTTSIIYADWEGVLRVVDLNNPPHASITTEEGALYYIMGGAGNFLDPAVPNNYEDGMSEAPERGVPLWKITTSGGSSFPRVDIARNVVCNGDPWGVTSRRTNTTPSFGAFDNLEAAFLHASMANTYASREDQCITIRIKGEVVLSNNAVVQPPNVHVEGTSEARVRATYGSTPDGMWHLSSGCTVSDVHFDCRVNTSIFRLADNVSISRCSVIYGIAVNTLYLVCTSTDHANVTLKDNTLDLIDGLINNTSTQVHTSWTIRDNRITQVRASTAAFRAMIDLSGTSHEIAGNRIRTFDDPASASAPLGIRVTGITNATPTADTVISENYIYLGAYDGSVHEYGIWVDGYSFNICNNEIVGNATSGTSSAIGIYIQNGENITIVGNQIGLVGTAISSGYENLSADSFVSNLFIKGNLIRGCYQGGIRLYITNDSVLPASTAVHDIDIVNNQISNVAKSVQPTPFFRTALAAIEVRTSDINVTYPLTGIRNINVSENNIDAVDNSFGGEAYGVRLQLEINTGVSARIRGVHVKNNLMSELDNTETFSATEGISIETLNGAGPLTAIVSDISVEGNTIEIKKSTTAPLGTPSCIRFSPKYGASLDNASVFGCNFNSNVLTYLTSSNVDFGYGVNIDTASYIQRSSVNDNTISARTFGIKACILGGTINGNNVTAHGVGIYSGSGEAQDLMISGNTVSVITYLANDLPAPPLAGSIGIYIHEDIVSCNISANQVRLTGTAQLLQDSANICVNEGLLFDVQSCVTTQYYSTLTAGNAYHMYINFQNTNDLRFSILGNTIHNARTMSTNDSHGLYLQGLAGAGNGLGCGMVMSNTIFGQNGGTWQMLGVGPAPPYEMYYEHGTTTANGPIAFMGNSVYVTNASTNFTPNAWFQTMFPVPSTGGELYRYNLRTNAITLFEAW